jgi:hypothetical protein
VVHTEMCVCVPYSIVLATVRSDMWYTQNSVCVCVCVCVPYSVVLATVRSDMWYTMNCVGVSAAQRCVRDGAE